MRKPLLLTVPLLLVACAAGRAADSEEKLVSELVAIFQNRENSGEVRSTAIRALAPLGWTGRPALSALIKLLEDPAERKSARDVIGPYYYAIEALGRMGPGARDAVPVLIHAKGVAPTYDLAIDAALDNILQQPLGGVVGLLTSLRENDPSLRLMAAKALGSYPVDAAVVLPALREAAGQDPDDDVRRVAQESADRVLKAEVLRLARLLQDRDENVRLLAAKALGRLGTAAEAAGPALKAAADNDADADVRCVAKNALEKVRGQP
jgi:HEAT repeat protein